MAPGALVAIVVAVTLIFATGRRWQEARLHRRHVLPFAVSLVGCALLWWVTGTTWATDSMTNLVTHMLSHVVIMFLVPIAFVYGGVSRQWWVLVPVGPRRALLRWWYVRRRRLPAWTRSPALACLAFNGAMVTAHVPVIFNYCMGREWAMQWLMDMGFFVSGLWFFHFLVPSTPRRVTTSLKWQAILVGATVLEMLFLAMSMSIFTRSAWYQGGAIAMGMTTTVGFDFHHQQLSAGILWVCGDFWAVPLAVVIVRRVMKRDGSLLSFLERQVAVGGPSRGGSA